jgi:hypothetical protein
MVLAALLESTVDLVVDLVERDMLDDPTISCRLGC